jgi:uncharacterized protein with NAD-binding domain and iron-sulfur cluster
MTDHHSRRQFLSTAGRLTAGAAAASVLGSPGRALAATKSFRDQVVVLGGGVGGLSAAQELAERGSKVTVIEPKALGGKARSMPVPGSGTGGRADLPGEHGFRFFPGFYKNVTDTMSRIPFAGNSNGVLGNLTSATQTMMTFPGDRQLTFVPSFNEDGLMQGVENVLTVISLAAGIPANETAYITRKMQVFVTSCNERRVGQWENVSWWDFSNAAKFSKNYQDLWGAGITKSLVAAKGDKASSRTIGLMGEAFVYALMAEAVPAIRAESGYEAADRLFDAPTNEAWIDPWVAHLRSLGVTFVSGYRASRFRMSGGKIVAANLQPTRGGLPDASVTADWFVAAMPVEQMTPLLSRDVLLADPDLARLRKLETDWMNGIQFYLNTPVKHGIRGHYAFLQSPWALTAVEQNLFWESDIAERYGDGSVTSIFSVDVSDWFTRGLLTGKRAVDCTPAEVADEVWFQMKKALNIDGQVFLSDDMLESWFLDPAISWPNGYGQPAANSEGLLINTVGSLSDRPDSTTKIPNLFLASDYVRVDVDLATMEGANEAARQAVNGLLAASGSSESPCSIGTLWQPRELEALRRTDQLLYRAGLPNALDVTTTLGLPI